MFVPLFPNLFDVPVSPMIFLLCSRVPIAKFPVFACSPKTPGGPSYLLQKKSFSNMYVSLNLVRSWSSTSDVIVVNFQMQLIIGGKRFLLVVAFVMENAWKKLPFVSNCFFFSNVLWYLLDVVLG